MSNARLNKVFEAPSEQDLSFLPPSYVIKLTFQSRGRGIVMVKEGIDLETRQPADIEEMKKRITPHVLPPRTSVTHQKVIIEELLEAENPCKPLFDVKLFYFASEFIFLQITDPSKRPADREYPRFHYSPTWERLPIHKQEAPLDQHVEKPRCLAAIIQWGDRIASTFFADTFIRLDFYATAQGAVFGETTLAPHFECTLATDKQLGALLEEKNICY